MKPSQITRRQLLKISLGTSGLYLGGCASFESLFTNQKRLLDEEVLIVGGGAAGLSAAYHCKKSGKAFRLFEGHERVGGRVFAATLSPQTRVDLGAEFFTSTDSTLLGLLKEFGFKPQSWSPLSESYMVGDKLVPVAQLRKQLPGFVRAILDIRQDVFRAQDVHLTFDNASRFDRVPHYDRMNLEELFALLSKKSSPEIVSAYRYPFETKYGTTADKISALHFINDLRMDGAKTFFLKESLGEFFQTLGQRVAGPLPDYFIRAQTELIEINEIPLGLELIFKTPKGRETYFAKKVVLALPPHQLLKIKGLENLEFEAPIVGALKSFQYGQLVKGVEAVESKGSEIRFLSTGTWWSDSNTRPGLRTILGKRDDELQGLRASDEWLAHRNWKQGRLNNRATSFYGPGLFANHWGVFRGSHLKGKIFFAGDFVSTKKPQSVEGALESGINAIEELIRTQEKKA